MNVQNVLKNIRTLHDVETAVANGVWRRSAIMALALLHHADVVKKPFERLHGTAEFRAFVEKYRLSRLKIGGEWVTAEDWVRKTYHPQLPKPAEPSVEPMEIG